MWVERLLDTPEACKIDKDAVLTAAVFHDVGYSALDNTKSHAENSADIFDEYAINNDFDNSKSDFISYLIRNHSSKELMFAEGTPMELIILMEADLLDETGAMAIVWDCMAEGAETEQSFVKAYEHIINYSGKILENNPMFTQKAKEFWSEKQKLVSEFIRYLAFDLAVLTK